MSAHAPTFATLQATVSELVARNALHRRGFRLDDVSDVAIVEHVIDEANELRDAINDATDVDALREAGDVLGALFHLANRRGWTHEMLATAAIGKLRSRFE